MVPSLIAGHILRIVITFIYGANDDLYQKGAFFKIEIHYNYGIYIILPHLKQTCLAQKREPLGQHQSDRDFGIVSPHFPIKFVVYCSPWTERCGVQVQLIELIKYSLSSLELGACMLAKGAVPSPGQPSRPTCT
jgi:hypothetical protein